jgi:hypothetical protein
MDHLALGRAGSPVIVENNASYTTGSTALEFKISGRLICN